MIIKSQKITYDNFMCDLEKVTSYKYLGIDLHDKLNQNYNIEKIINGRWKAYYGLENSCKSIKTRVQFQNIRTYDNFMYGNNNLEKVTLYKYIGIDLHDKLNQNYSIEKNINGGWKAYYGLENSCKSIELRTHFQNICYNTNLRNL